MTTELQCQNKQQLCQQTGLPYSSGVHRDLDLHSVGSASPSSNMQHLISHKSVGHYSTESASYQTGLLENSLGSLPFSCLLHIPVSDCCVGPTPPTLRSERCTLRGRALHSLWQPESTISPCLLHILSSERCYGTHL